MSRVSGLVERVRLMIVRGEVPAGGRMVEFQLAEYFRTSRTTMREVLRQLEGDGLLIANMDGGMRVVELSREDLIAALQVRAALEALSAGLAAEHTNHGHLPPDALSRLSELADVAATAAQIGAAEDAVWPIATSTARSTRLRERALPRRARSHLGPDHRRVTSVDDGCAAAGVGRP